MTVVTRFAPSPTGFLHIGGARTALFNWLFARHHGGKFLLRIEDTDQARSTPEAITAILQSMKWLELNWDGPEIYQSQRFARHREVAENLVKQGKAYYCYCSPTELEQMREQALAQGLPPRYNGMWRDRDPSEAPSEVKPVIRLKAPRTGSTVIEDGVQGRVEVDNSQLDDMVLLRSDGTPTYMLSVVVDDHDMEITHIIRGDDHLNNAFRQYHLYAACEWFIPSFNHIPLIHGSDGAKLSKRHGALGVEAYKDMGFLPEALNNYLLRLGWGHGDAEIISRQQATEWFDIKGIGRSAARFDMAKLTHLNGHYLREADPKNLMEQLRPWVLAQAASQNLTPNDRNWQWLQAGLPELQLRAKTMVDLARDSMFYLHSSPLPLSEEGKKILASTDKELLLKIANLFSEIMHWTEEELEAQLRGLAEALEVKLVKVAQPLRIALTGSAVSPSIFAIMKILGKEETIKRIKSL